MARTPPDYTGTGLVNLIAEIEHTLAGAAPSPRLTAGSIPAADGYVLVVFDGLGTHQLGHSAASPLSAAHQVTLKAGFPTTTTVSLGTVATGLPPSAHGLIGHILHLPGIAETVNTLKWVTPSGQPVDHDYASFLPAPNLWERLGGAGVEPITVQPGAVLDSPLSRLLYRGCRFEAAWSRDELVQATIDVAGPGRLVVVYYPNVDVAAHVSGQASEAYRDALAGAASAWEKLSFLLPDEIGLVGTADHGHLDYGPDDKVLIRQERFDQLLLYGDPRSVYASGPPELIEELAVEAGADIFDVAQLIRWLGGDPRHPDLDKRLPDRLLLAPRGKILLPKAFDKRLIGYHGGLEAEEIEIPLLTR